LPNRSQFQKRLLSKIDEVALESSEKSFFSVMFLDLDGFKDINDRFGHDNGDWLVNQVAHRLRQSLTKEDFIARLGGDEFGIILHFMAGLSSLERVAHRLVSYIGSPYYHDTQTYRITASIGIARFPESGRDPQMLLKNADKAMYQAKQAGKNNYKIF
jgi:diguanylate cyclase (GGDEF)-like protein